MLTRGLIFTELATLQTFDGVAEQIFILRAVVGFWVVLFIQFDHQPDGTDLPLSVFSQGFSRHMRHVLMKS
ncbi:hypothetical protein A8F97_07670 [Pectobacterium parmentieri]|nr:hypothetical protein A8F97_07670 [Pectobacterium parmentieri]